MASEIAIMHILNGEHYSGLERVVDQLSELAPDYGYRLHLVFLKPLNMRLRMKSTQAIIHECPMRNKLDLLASAKTIATIAKTTQCQLIHSHCVRSSLVAAIVKKKTQLPWICHVHNAAINESVNLWRNLVNFSIEAIVLRDANKVLAVSNAIAQYLKKFYKLAHHRLKIIPNGVDASLTPNSKNSKTPHTMIAALGLFRPTKGIEDLITAARLLIDTGYPVNLRIIGEFADKRYEAKMKQLVEQLNLLEHVEFIGFVEEVNKQLATCDILAFPSLQGEGLPMAILEAMAMGLPIVATNIPGITEILEQGAGLLVPPRSPKLLAEAITQILSDKKLAHALSFEAKKQQQERYSVKTMCNTVFHNYDRLLAQNLRLCHR